jgi:hypothetical protein
LTSKRATAHEAERNTTPTTPMRISATTAAEGRAPGKRSADPLPGARQFIVPSPHCQEA